MDKVTKVGQLSIFRAERLGSGRLGGVFTGKIKDVEEEIAIKRMMKKKVRVDFSLCLKTNGNPNIITYYGTDYYSDVQFIYLAIEYCMGTLVDLVCGGYEDFAMTDESHLPVIRQITAGLNQLHSLGIVHGNLKPSNILVSFPKGDTNEPMMKLADFGIRHAVTDEANRLTQFQLITTEGWMCSTDSQDPIQPSFDVFSLGCVCGFIFLNGLHPFGTDPISGIKNRQPIRLNLGQEKCKVLTPALLDLIARMLNFDSSKRPSAADVLLRPMFSQQQSTLVSSRLNATQQIPDLVPCIPTTSSHCSYSNNSSTSSSLRHQSPSLAVKPRVISSSSSLQHSPCASASGSSEDPLSSNNKNINSPSLPQSLKLPEFAKPLTNPKSSISHRNLPYKFSCDYCFKLFTFLGSRDEHMTIHTGDKPFECGECHQVFGDLGTLRQHRKKHSEAKHECPFCKKKFTLSYVCKRHWNVNKKGHIACTIRRRQLYRLNQTELAPINSK